MIKYKITALAVCGFLFLSFDRSEAGKAPQDTHPPPPAPPEISQEDVDGRRQEMRVSSEEVQEVWNWLSARGDSGKLLACERAVVAGYKYRFVTSNAVVAVYKNPQKERVIMDDGG